MGQPILLLIRSLSASVAIPVPAVAPPTTSVIGSILNCRLLFRSKLNSFQGTLPLDLRSSWSYQLTVSSAIEDELVESTGSQRPRGYRYRAVSFQFGSIVAFWHGSELNSNRREFCFKEEEPYRKRFGVSGYGIISRLTITNDREFDVSGHRSVSLPNQ
jgi:hypothetical protein